MGWSGVQSLRPHQCTRLEIVQRVRAGNVEKSDSGVWQVVNIQHADCRVDSISGGLCAKGIIASLSFIPSQGVSIQLQHSPEY